MPLAIILLTTIALSYRFTQVWLKLDGRWQVVAVHVSARVGPEARSE